jgi:RecA-family ATPase
VSLTAGPGGLGKSSQSMVEGIAMATARNLLGEQPEERLRIWIHNGEDPMEEILRRLAAICQHYGIPQHELQGYLWLTSGNEFPLRVAKGYSNLEINAALVHQISEAVGANEIDVAMFDPLVTLHSVSEGDPGKMDTVIRIFAGIADEHNAGVELNHHVRKPAAGAEAEHDLHDIRGVMAITDAVRAARVLNRMSKSDAEAAGIEELDRLAYFRVDKGKGNYSRSRHPMGLPRPGRADPSEGGRRPQRRARVPVASGQVRRTGRQRERQYRSELRPRQVRRRRGGKGGQSVKSCPEDRHDAAARLRPH